MKKKNQTEPKRDISPVAQRLLEYINIKGLNVSEFEKMCGLANGYINGIRKSIKPDTFNERIKPKFPELNMYWVLHGQGDMYNADLNPEKIVSNANYNDFVLAVLVDEIASLKATTKGSLFVDERDAIMSKIERVSSRH